MADVEKRLAALEKRARDDVEQWQKVSAEIKGLKIIIEAVILPLCAASPKAIPTVIANLRSFEGAGRIQNEHEALIREVRKMREFLESKVVVRGQSSTGAPPRRGK